MRIDYKYIDIKGEIKELPELIIKIDLQNWQAVGDRYQINGKLIFWIKYWRLKYNFKRIV